LYFQLIKLEIEKDNPFLVIKNNHKKLGMVAHTSNPSIQEVKAGGLKVEASLPYLVSSRSA
jgi:hypothetical protein